MGNAAKQIQTNIAFEKMHLSRGYNACWKPTSVSDLITSHISTNQSLRTSASYLNTLVYKMLRRSTLSEPSPSGVLGLLSGHILGSFLCWVKPSFLIVCLAKTYWPPSGMDNIPVLAVFRAVIAQWLRFWTHERLNPMIDLEPLLNPRARLLTLDCSLVCLNWIILFPF